MVVKKTEHGWGVYHCHGDNGEDSADAKLIHEFKGKNAHARALKMHAAILANEAKPKDSLGNTRASIAQGFGQDSIGVIAAEGHYPYIDKNGQLVLKYKSYDQLKQ